MSLEIANFFADFERELRVDADVDQQYIEDAFFDKVCSVIIETGELETADRCPYLGQRGLRIDGYGGDPQASSGDLSLIIADYNQSTELSTLTGTDMEAIFKRATNFVEKCLDPEFRAGLEETSPAFGLADIIAGRWEQVTRVRLFLISNRRLSSRVDGRKSGEIRGRHVTYNVWDLDRLYRLAISGRAREDVVIDLVNEYGGAVPALPAHLLRADYRAYLVVVPGRLIAQIYDRWGARLLEQNVRVFLQARAKVNKGIRSTLETEPEMFFAYNNGITATAESVETVVSNGSLTITTLKNLQIVNGGQTTASIHSVSKQKNVNMSGIYVQMKLSVIDPARAEEIVPKISEYANTQNKVNAADFFSNHPFHIRMADFSKRLLAPSAEGSFRESKWFYERSRGQYEDAQATLTPAQKKKFALEYPKRQMIKKEEFAKYQNPWRGLPHVVSKGAQKNFAFFAAAIASEWAKQPDQFNESYYQHAVANAIIFREMEKIVSAQTWYENAYRANFVPYAIARFAVAVETGGAAFDFDAVWKAQDISENLREALTLSLQAVHHVIMDPAPGIHNITEWAKAQACWTRAEEYHVPWPAGLLDKLRSVETKKELRSSGLKEQRMLSGIEAQIAVVKAGADTWRKIQAWADARHVLTDVETGVLKVATLVPGKVPSEYQSLAILAALRKLREEGCRLAPHVL